MKRKMILSLVMAAAVTLGASGMATNANFNATAASNGNVFTTGSVLLQNSAGTTGYEINMGKLFSASNMVFDKVATTTTDITIEGTLPVVLSAKITGSTLPWNEVYVSAKDGVDAHFEGSLTNYFATIDPAARWWRQYKMSFVASVIRNGVTTTVASRPSDDDWKGYDSFFDTLTGTSHNGPAPTKGISEVLAGLGTLHSGDKVTLTTQMKLVSDFYDGSGNQLGTLTNEQQNIFQNKTIGADVKIIATQVDQ